MGAHRHRLRHSERLVDSSTTSSKNSEHPSGLSYVLVFAVAVLVYSKAFSAEFVYDDRQAILANDDAIGATSSWFETFGNDFWGNPIRNSGSHKSYRPLVTLSFRLQNRLHGLRPHLFHGTNVLLHGVVSCFLLRLAAVFLQSRASVLATLLFAVHAVNSEAVCSVVGRADLVAAAWLLAALLHFHTHQNTKVAFVFATLALLSKETGIVVLPLLILQQIVFHQINSKSMRKVAEMSAQLSTLCYMRLFVNGFQSPRFSSADNPTAHESSIFVRSATFLYLPIFHLSLIIFPSTLSFDWSMGAISQIRSPFDVRLPMTLLVYAGISMLLWKLAKNLGTHRRILGIFSLMTGSDVPVSRAPKENCTTSLTLFLLLFLVVSHIPSSNLLCHVGFVAAERILYATNIAMCLLFGVFVQLILHQFQKRHNLVTSIVVLLLAIHSSRTWTRSGDWQSEENLFRSSLHVNPPKAWANLGHVYAARHDVVNAQRSYEMALQLRPNMADTWYNLGILMNENGDVNKSASCYKNALRFRPNFAPALLNLALLEWSQGEEQKALDRLEKCFAESDDNGKFFRSRAETRTHCLFNKGRLLASRRRHQESVVVLQKALQSAPRGYPQTAALLNSLGDVFAQIGDDTRAEVFFNRALDSDPRHVNTHLTFAQLRMRQNRSDEATTWLVKAQTLAPTSPVVLQHSALAAHAQGNYNASESLYKASLQLDKTHVESWRGLAHLLRDCGRTNDSEKAFARLCRLRPGDFSSFANYAATLHLNGKLEAALEAYEAALRLNPGDQTTIDNRAKLLRKMRKT